MLELYQAEDCPHSTAVREAMTDLGISCVLHNPRRHGGEVRNEQTHDELVDLGGEDQIPFLVDHQRRVAMHESEDIIDYLETHYG